MRGTDILIGMALSFSTSINYYYLNSIQKENFQEKKKKYQKGMVLLVFSEVNFFLNFFTQYINSVDKPCHANSFF